MADVPEVNNGRPVQNRQLERIRAWRSPLAILSAGLTAFLTLSGLSILLAPFGVPNQVMVLLHTVLGIAFLIPCGWYLVRHFRQYLRSPVSHNLVLGYLGGGVLIVCSVSGVVLTAQAAFGTRISYAWDTVHIVTTFAILAFGLPHVFWVALKERKARTAEMPSTAGHYGKGVLVVTLGSLAAVALAIVAYRPVRLRNEFPADYSFKYGADRPFAPSLARTATNRAIDPRVLSGSRSCGTAGCHEEIVKEWEPSVHRYAAMDAGFQKIQTDMARQNGPESTRYCGGCHDPISLFSGAKNLFIEEAKLTALEGYQEGVSCLACHSVRKVDVKGNANYTLAPPERYMFELEYDRSKAATSRFLRDFLIRAYPRQHVADLTKKLFKASEYCAACHKQFIDQEINNVGWVQLQNQYDNWRQSHWNKQGDPRKTVECRECHMPLVASRDPAAGDAQDYNRASSDGKHRSHRFIAANQMMPAILKLPGWEKQVELTEQWLKGDYQVPEIADKWRNGKVVNMELKAPDNVRPGEKVDLKLVLTSNKVGHDFPTGQLDIIQTWLEVVVRDDAGRVLFSRGTVNDKGFIEPGTFMFKAEPVDQSGNLIDRHNLWEMVGVRYRRSLFPGFSDTAEFNFVCPSMAPAVPKPFPQQLSYAVEVPRAGARRLRVDVLLRYRKIDQYLLNFMFGEKSGITSPITDMAVATRHIAVGGAPTARGDD